MEEDVFLWVLFACGTERWYMEILRLLSSLWSEMCCPSVRKLGQSEVMGQQDDDRKHKNGK